MNLDTTSANRQENFDNSPLLADIEEYLGVLLLLLGMYRDSTYCYMGI